MSQSVLFRSRAAWASLLLVGALTTSCSSSSGGSAGANGDPKKFCEATDKLDKASASVSGDDLKGAVKFLDDNKSTFDELRASAPANLRDDIDVSLASLRARATGATPSQAESDKADAAQKAVSDYHDKTCASPSSSSS